MWGHPTPPDSPASEARQGAFWGKALPLGFRSHACGQVGSGLSDLAMRPGARGLFFAPRSEGQLLRVMCGHED